MDMGAGEHLAAGAHITFSGGFVMFDTFLDVVFYPLYQINVSDPFMGILCGMLIIFWLFHFLCSLFGWMYPARKVIL